MGETELPQAWQPGIRPTGFDASASLWPEGESGTLLFKRICAGTEEGALSAGAPGGTDQTVDFRQVDSPDPGKPQLFFEHLLGWNVDLR